MVSLEKLLGTASSADNLQGGSGGAVRAPESPFEYKKQCRYLCEYNTDAKMELLLSIRVEGGGPTTISGLLRRNSGYPKTKATLRALINSQINSGGLMVQRGPGRKRSFFLSRELETELSKFFEMFHSSD